MADSHTLLAFALTCWVFVLIPGPSVLFVISRGVTLGRRAAVLTVFGNAAGILCQLLFVAAGVGAVLERSQVAYNVLRLAGAAYIVWLGIQAIRHRLERLGGAGGLVMIGLGARLAVSGRND